MSDLTAGQGGNGRAANNGARAASGPTPVTQPPAGIRTPQMIMNQRRERESRRAAEADAARAAEEQRKQEEERRRSAERRALAAGVAGVPRDSGAERVPQPTAPRRPTADGGYGTYPPAPGMGAPRDPERLAGGGPVQMPQSQDATAGAQSGRPRASSQAQQQSRPAPVQGTPIESRRPQASQSHARQPSTSGGAPQPRPGASTAPPPQPTQAGPSGTQPGQARGSTVSSFPHAFERWETLSSHWEGLTSYWIRRLEQNTEEIRRDSLAQQMSRQITDLSAAGANLFHAVVELQRLRASSERKFQRWFYEHRQEQERAQEMQAQAERSLAVERQARQEAVANADLLATEKKNADRMVAEMKRELQISKEEARRAWEELGRREQEERERQMSLRDGQPTLVGGVQVVPMTGGMPSRHGSVSQRPTTRDDPYQGGSSGQGMEQQYSYEEGQSPTDTDPFTEGRHAPGVRHEPDIASLAHGTYIPTGARQTGESSTATRTTQGSDYPQVPAPLHPHRTTAQQPTVPTTTSPEAFYQQPAAYLHEERPTSLPEDERSYVTSQGDETSEGDEEYVIDQYGNFVLDAAGHRVPYRHVRSQESDEFDVGEDRRRELEHLQRYGTGAGGSGGYVATTSGAPAYGQGQASHQTAQPDYSGAGYGSEWAGMRHHHPTRLSDVLEEDERSRTSPSRASQASRGLF